MRFMKMHVSAKAALAKALACMMVLSAGSAFSACKKKSNVPSKKEVSKICQSQPQYTPEEDGFTYEELRKAWGEPDKEIPYLTGWGDMKLWDNGEHFLYASILPNDGNKVMAISISTTLDLIFLRQDEDYTYFAMVFADHSGIHDVVAFENGRLDAEDLGAPQFGDLYHLEYNGVIFQSYPAQIDYIFRLLSDGKADDEKIEYAKNVLVELDSREI